MAQLAEVHELCSDLGRFVAGLERASHVRTIAGRRTGHGSRIAQSVLNKLSSEAIIES
jgi:hypothetical protein